MNLDYDRAEVMIYIHKPEVGSLTKLAKEINPSLPEKLNLLVESIEFPPSVDHLIPAGVVIIVPESKHVIDFENKDGLIDVQAERAAERSE